jgi:RND family efflux transporter MFP subunit
MTLENNNANNVYLSLLRNDYMKLTRVSLMHIRFFIVVISILMLPACGKPPEPETKEDSRPVKLMTLGSAGDSVTLEYPGVIDSLQSVDLGFEVAGQIIDLPIISGQEVMKGDLLARLDPRDYKAARDSAESKRRSYRADYGRAKRIFDLGAGSQANVDQTLRDIEVAIEELKTAQKALDDTYLRAPFSGEIAEIPPDNFQNVEAKEKILKLQDLSSLEIDVAVPEQDIALSPPGLSLEERTQFMRPEIEVSVVPGQRFPAKYKKIDSTADPVTRTYPATFSFANPADIIILPGMTAKVIVHIKAEKLTSTGKPGFMIPVDATAVDEQSNAYVWRVDPDTMQVSRMRVELGAMSGEKIRILNGLEQGDRIAISGVHHLREGMKVRPLSK